MASKYLKLTRSFVRKTMVGEKIVEHGICFERLRDGDGRYSVNIMVDRQRIHRVIGKESEGVTRKQAEDFIENARADARNDRLNLPKGRKLSLGFREAAKKYLTQLGEEGGKDIPKKNERFNFHLIPFFAEKPLIKISTFDIERYKKNRLSEDAANGTIYRELAVLSHLFNKAVEWKWINHKPLVIKRLKEDTGRITYLTTEQIYRLIEFAKKDQNQFVYPFIVTRQSRVLSDLT